MIIFKEITGDKDMLVKASLLVREHSWGFDYPVDPYEELKNADFVVGCFDEEKIIGLASVSKFVSPDKIDNGFPWLASAVISPEYRNNGIYRELYIKRMEYLKNKKENLVLTCTDNPIIEKFLLNKGWRLRRTTKDESGGDCQVFEVNI